MNIVAARGSGKSRLLGRILLPQDAYNDVPTIMIDPIGETINNFLSKVSELPRAIQEKIWPRVRYIDMAGRNGYVAPFPLLYRLGTESLYQIAQRPLEVFRMADPFLREAPIHGWNPLWLIGTHAGRVLAACNCQISELEHLLVYPDQWEGRFQQIEQQYPEVAKSTAFFRRFAKWSGDRRLSRSESLLIKTSAFTLDPTTLAMFSASDRAMDIYKVIDERQIVLVDMSGVTDTERRRFMLIWLISYITTFIKHRGPGHHHHPLSLVIDEFSLLTHDEVFSQELDELINVYSRSHRLWITVASQSIGQFNEKTQRALLSLGTQIFGAVPDIESGKKLAESFGTFSLTYAPMIDQIQTMAQQLRALEKFSFLIRPAGVNRLYSVHIRDIDAGQWINPDIVERAKSILRKRSGLPIAPLLSDITSRVPRLTISDALSQSRPLVTLPKHETQRNYLPPQDTEEDVY